MWPLRSKLENGYVSKLNANILPLLLFLPVNFHTVATDISNQFPSVPFNRRLVKGDDTWMHEMIEWRLKGASAESHPPPHGHNSDPSAEHSRRSLCQSIFPSLTCPALLLLRLRLLAMTIESNARRDLGFVVPYKWPWVIDRNGDRVNL